MKLTAEHCGIVVSVEISDDAPLHLVFNAFATLAVGMTYHPATFLEAATTYVDENTPGGIKNAEVPEEF